MTVSIWMTGFVHDPPIGLTWDTEPFYDRRDNPKFFTVTVSSSSDGTQPGTTVRCRAFHETAAEIKVLFYPGDPVLVHGSRDAEGILDVDDIGRNVRLDHPDGQWPARAPHHMADVPA